MKNFSISIAALTLALASGSAFAADLPTQKAPPVVAAPAPMWTGFYAGLNLGGNIGTNGSFYSQNYGLPSPGTVFNGVLVGAGRISTSPMAMSGAASNTQSGVIGGGQIGYNHQWGSNYVVGIEADFQGTSTSGASRTQGYFIETSAVSRGDASGSTAANTGLNYLGTVRGRVGYLWNPSLLLYGTGGFAYGGAWANVSQTVLSVASISSPALTGTATGIRFGGGQQNQLLTGWTAGGGFEWMFMTNWSMKAEALYWDLGRMNINTFATSTNSGNSWGRSSVNYAGVTARAGVNYHFNFGSAPVVAKF